MKVLVTGPTGAVGQYVLEMLMTTDHDVRVFALPDSMHRINFRDRIEMVPGQLSDPVALEEAVDGVDIVFHTALAAAPPPLKPEFLHETNVEGTENLLAACAGRIQRFVLVTSNIIYAEHKAPAVWPIRDDSPRMINGDPQQAAYIESLIRAEDAVFEAAARGDVSYTILRPGAIAGRKSPFVDGIIVGLIRDPRNQQAQRLVFDVMQWSHGSDIARAALLVAEDSRAENQCYLVAGDEPVTVYDVQSAMWEVMNVGRPNNPHAEKAARHNLGLTKYDPAGLRALGWYPQVGVKQCVAEVLGRLEFFSSAAIELPSYLMDE